MEKSRRGSGQVKERQCVVGHLLPPTTPHQPPQTALVLPRQVSRSRKGSGEVKRRRLRGQGEAARGQGEAAERSRRDGGEAVKGQGEAAGCQ